MSEKIELTEEQADFLLSIENGADIIAYGLARTGREIQKQNPQFINIVEAQGDYDPVGQLPYYGAIATQRGIDAANRLRNGR